MKNMANDIMNKHRKQSKNKAVRNGLLLNTDIYQNNI